MQGPLGDISVSRGDLLVGAAGGCCASPGPSGKVEGGLDQGSLLPPLLLLGEGKCVALGLCLVTTLLGTVPVNGG